MFAWLAQFRLRLLFRGAFLLLAVATVILAITLLQQEKQLSYQNYQNNFKKTEQQILATLRHPTGQLALLNPPSEKNAAQLHPILLPFAAIDFDDQNKAQQAIALSGCLLQYGENTSLCVGIGSNPWAGGYIYAAGSFLETNLMSHESGERDLTLSHRAIVRVKTRGEDYSWVAPFEAEPPTHKIQGIYGRLTGFWEQDVGKLKSRPVKDFRGWIWQKYNCKRPIEKDQNGNCKKEVFFSLRLPVAIWQEALFVKQTPDNEKPDKQKPEWPPQDLEQTQVDIEIISPEAEKPVFSSKQSPSAAPFSLSDLQASLLPGESLSIIKLDAANNEKINKAEKPKPLIALVGPSAQADEYWRFIAKLIRQLPVDDVNEKLEAEEIISTPFGNYSVKLKGDIGSVNKSLGVVATRVSGYVAAMFGALFLAWLLIEIGIIHRITLLTKRADNLSKSDLNAGGLDRFDVSDLRNRDELGILATCLHNLFRRVQEDAKREAIRAEQEKDMWHAVGHEIMSPLQSLMVLHGGNGDLNENPSARYIHRMQQAVRVLYGSASPSEAFQSTVLQIAEIDLVAFLKNISENASFINIHHVKFSSQATQLMARADEYSLEDVIGHVLRNADRYRTPNSAIEITLEQSETEAVIQIFNQGPPIPNEMLDKIFEYGVSDQPDSGAQGNRGQGLFVAKTYMAKMGGTIAAENVDDGVTFVLRLQLVDKN